MQNQSTAAFSQICLTLLTNIQYASSFDKPSINLLTFFRTQTHAPTTYLPTRPHLTVIPELGNLFHPSQQCDQIWLKFAALAKSLKSWAISGGLIQCMANFRPTWANFNAIEQMSIVVYCQILAKIIYPSGQSAQDVLFKEILFVVSALSSALSL